MDFVQLLPGQEDKIQEMSTMASTIVKEHYDPIIGPAQNDYMIKKFQSVESIREQLEHGYRYYFAKINGKNVGFCAFYPKDKEIMYLSKFYIYKDQRGQGYSRIMSNFIAEETRKEGLKAIELNVNKNNTSVPIYKKLGYREVRTEKNPIGNGFYMDDYILRLDV